VRVGGWTVPGKLPSTPRCSLRIWWVAAIQLSWSYTRAPSQSIVPDVDRPTANIAQGLAGSTPTGAISHTEPKVELDTAGRPHRTVNSAR